MTTRKLPDKDKWFIAPVVMDWWQQYQDDGLLDKEMALPNSRIRASWAGDCSRALAYHVAGEEESDPVTVADCWRFNVGQLLHEMVQDKIERAFPGSISEVKVRIGEDGSGHMDMWVVRPDGRTCGVEVKSINGTGFRRATNTRDPEGVRVKAVMQGAVNAYCHDPQPDELVIAVFSLECISPADARKNGLADEFDRFAAQWTFSKEEYSAIAREEMERWDLTIETVDAQGPGAVPKIIPDPSMPRHTVSNPSKGTIAIQGPDGRTKGLGWTWHCGYCPYQSKCAGEP